MYQESSECIRSAVSNIKEGNIEIGQRDISLAEAKLPIEKSRKNTIVSRYVTIFSFLYKDRYEYDDEAVEVIAAIGEKLSQEITNDEFNDKELASEIREARRLFTIKGDVQRASENSAWGKIVRDMLEED